MDSNLPAKAQEVQVELQKDQHQFEIAKITISANLENQKGWRDHFQKSRRDYMIFWAVVIFLVLAFCCIAMFTGKDEIALEIIKSAVFLGAGGGAGYAYGFRKGQLSVPMPNQQENNNM